MNQGQTQLMNHNWNNAKVKYPGLTETCLMVYASVFYKNLHGWFITNYHQIYLLALFNHSMKLKPCVNPPCVTDNCSVYTLIIWMIKCLILSYSNYISIKKEEQIVIFFLWSWCGIHEINLHRLQWEHNNRAKGANGSCPHLYQGSMGHSRNKNIPHRRSKNCSSCF